MEQNVIRCAIYTRKSTEEGLDKEFNTLEAQREAGENYIKSQKNLGWELIPEHYDDGGFSGGSLKRPALKRLLEDVENGKVDMIVVYKIDRLTRSLLDFSQLIKILDAHNCSFVSVTQNFNTCDSMGKLTLNILLSFAQFEREVSAERIRDKIAATKKKGMWTGGSIPLGYNVENKKLIVNHEEAKIVRYIFEEYLRCRSEVQVSRNANELGYHSKPRKVRNSSGEVALSFNHAMINNMLRNPIYIGKIQHKGELYDGQHKPIIPMKLWNMVQELKRLNRGDRFAPSRSIKNSLLKGLVECECCGAMSPTRCKKKNKYYEYYTSIKAIKEGYHLCKVGSIPAGELDSFVLEKVKSAFRSPEIIQELVHQVKKHKEGYGVKEIYDIVQSMDKVFEHFEPVTIQNIINKLIAGVLIKRDRILIRFKPFGISLLDDNIKIRENGYNAKTLEFTYNVTFARKRGRIKIVEPLPDPNAPRKDETMIQAISQAFRWQELQERTGLNIAELAKKEKFDRTYMGRILKLCYLAPEIIQAILDGTQPPLLNLQNFTRSQIPVLWSDQLKKYGFKHDSF